MKLSTLGKVSPVLAAWLLAVIMVAPGVVSAASSAQAPAGAPFSLVVEPAQLLIDRVGVVRTNGNKMEIKDRQYQGEFGAFDVTVVGSPYVASEVKVISNLKLQNGPGEHQGTIDVDIDAIPGGHITLAYKGTASIAGSTIISNGKFEVKKATGAFAGTTAKGNYSMTIVEMTGTLGLPVATVSISANSGG